MDIAAGQTKYPGKKQKHSGLHFCYAGQYKQKIMLNQNIQKSILTLWLDKNQKHVYKCNWFIHILAEYEFADTPKRRKNSINDCQIADLLFWVFFHSQDVPY